MICEKCKTPYYCCNCFMIGVHKEISLGKNKTITLREHRGGYLDSMETVVEIERSAKSILDYMQSKLSPYNFEINKWSMHKYVFDDRNNWDTYILMIEGYGVFGFTDGPIYKK